MSFKESITKFLDYLLLVPVQDGIHDLGYDDSWRETRSESEEILDSNANQTTFSGTCQYIFGKGNKVGQQCTTRSADGENFCKTHLKRHQACSSTSKELGRPDNVVFQGRHIVSTPLEEAPDSSSGRLDALLERYLQNTIVTTTQSIKPVIDPNEIVQRLCVNKVHAVDVNR